MYARQQGFAIAALQLYVMLRREELSRYLYVHEMVVTAPLNVCGSSMGTSCLAGDLQQSRPRHDDVHAGGAAHVITVRVAVHGDAVLHYGPVQVFRMHVSTLLL